MNSEKGVEIWGGIESTINRVGDDYFDQCAYSGHYERGVKDIDLVASLGINMLRYPILWERYAPDEDSNINWDFAKRSLDRMKEQDITPIAGLVHHGSGPRHVNFFDGSFEEGLALYAGQVARRFPWLEYYTPVNEPLTTARFCGLYGHWHPHGKTDYSFYKVLLSECKATVMAMKKIREINPDAKLIQTEDLGKCYSTPMLAYQAEMENHRRWLSYDLLCGRVNQQHYMWKWLIKAGIEESDVLYFRENNCIPHIAGFNYYITSERYLDEDLSKYPKQYHGGNYKHKYADIETVLVPLKEENGPALLLKEAGEHLKLPLAITECHLHSTREDQMRWFHSMWKTVNKVKEEGVDIRAITAWALFGLYGWNCLVTKPFGDYEPGVFNLSSGCPRPTALARVLQELTKHQVYYHPVLENEGWWQKDTRQQYGISKVVNLKKKKTPNNCSPILILGKNGNLNTAFTRVCEARNIYHLLIKDDLTVANLESTKKMIDELHPWAVIDTGLSKIDEADEAKHQSFVANGEVTVQLAQICRDQNIRFISVSSEQVFDGKKRTAYVESDQTNPLNVLGQSQAMAEAEIMKQNSDALIIRIGSLISSWDRSGFILTIISALKEGKAIKVANDVFVSPTYALDAATFAIDLLLDGDSGIYHIAGDEIVSWAQLAEEVAFMAGYDASLIDAVPQSTFRRKVKQPLFSPLTSEKGIKMPSLEQALKHCFEELGGFYQSQRIAI